MGRIRIATVFVAVMGFAAVARAEPNGVPSIDGDWTGTLKSVYFDHTVDGATDPKQKYSGTVTVAIEQTGGALGLTIDFTPAFPTSAMGGFATVGLEGSVGNFHLSIGNGLDDPLFTGTGKISRSGRKITVRGVLPGLDVSHEFVMKLVRPVP